MAAPITITKISSVSIGNDPKKPIRNDPPRQLAALTHLPPRLDAAACLRILDSLHEDWTPTNVTALHAAGQKLDVADVDSGLEYKSLSIEDRFILKSALAEFGFIARGKKVS
jgi:hypothetical protein